MVQSSLRRSVRPRSRSAATHRLWLKLVQPPRLRQIVMVRDDLGAYHSLLVLRLTVRLRQTNQGKALPAGLSGR